MYMNEFNENATIKRRLVKSCPKNVQFPMTTESESKIQGHWWSVKFQTHELFMSDDSKEHTIIALDPYYSRKKSIKADSFENMYECVCVCVFIVRELNI